MPKTAWQAWAEHRLNYKLQIMRGDNAAPGVVVQTRVHPALGIAAAR
jgi:hypothetical protein